MEEPLPATPHAPTKVVPQETGNDEFGYKWNLKV